MQPGHASTSAMQLLSNYSSHTRRLMSTANGYKWTPCGSWFFFNKKKMNLLINIVWEMNKIVWIVLSRFFKRKFQKGKKDNGEAIYLSAVSNWNVSSRLSTDWPTGSVQKIPQLPEWKRASKKGREQTEPIWNGEGDICYVKGNNEINEADCVKTDLGEHQQHFRPAGWPFRAACSFCLPQPGTDAPVSAAPSLCPTVPVWGGEQQGAVQLAAQWTVIETHTDFCQRKLGNFSHLRVIKYELLCKRAACGLKK